MLSKYLLLEAPRPAGMAGGGGTSSQPLTASNALSSQNPVTELWQLKVQQRPRVSTE